MQPSTSVHYAAEVVVLEEQEQDDSQSRPLTPEHPLILQDRQPPEHSLEEPHSEPDCSGSSPPAEAASGASLLRSVTVRSVLARALDGETSPVAAREHLQPCDGPTSVNVAASPAREKQLSSAPDDEARAHTCTPAVVGVTL